jgi:serine/threonine protein phosphatase PrpC
MLEIEFAQLSDTGRVRPENEDYAGSYVPPASEDARSRGWLFALADGVGGHEKGEVASRTAIEAILSGFEQSNRGEPLSTLLPRLVQNANAKVFEAAAEAGLAGSGMATTLVACALRYDRAAIAHVGDSRCYLIRNNEASILTRDHTVANEHARLGFLSEEEALESDTRHILSRSLGTALVANVETSDHQILAGDVLLLCSDGLHGCVKPHEIATALYSQPDLKIVARKLVALANERDGSDNVTVQLVRVRSVERVGMYRGRPYKLR